MCALLGQNQVHAPCLLCNWPCLWCTCRHSWAAIKIAELAAVLFLLMSLKPFTSPQDAILMAAQLALLKQLVSATKG